MVDLVAARADGVLAAFRKCNRAPPQYGGSQQDNHAMQGAWFSGYDAETTYQAQQLDLPMVSTFHREDKHT